MRAFLISLTLLGLPCPAVADESTDPRIEFDIPAQPLTGALQAFAIQAHLQILFRSETVNTLRGPALIGSLTAAEALDVLLQGTPLESVRTGDVVVVRDATSMASAPEDREQPVLGEALVTGTLIRGARSASPLIVLDRADLERTGYTTTRQWIQSLPQTFGGGDNEGTLASPGGSPLNVALGSSINLRGLGSDSSLVLIDGHRVAPAAFGQFVDLSLIPLSAIERIEILTDGASATYGSDAVAGVVNFILRDDVQHPETRLLGGAVTQGSLEEYQFTQTLGASGEAGRALLIYDFYKRSNLAAAERSFAAGIEEPFDLLPSQKTQSLLVSAHADWGDRVAARATGLFSERDAQLRLFNTVTGDPTVFPATTRQLNAAVGADIVSGPASQVRIDATYSHNRTSRDVATTALESAERNESRLIALDVGFERALFPTPTGSAQLALGTSLRRERYARSGSQGLVDAERTVTAAFAELRLPLARAELSFAERYERYSDFGSTQTPKLGLVWSPTEKLRLRSTYGRSFRAPALNELDDSNVTSLVLDLPDPSAPDAVTRALLISGHNPELQSEEATTWTVGVDVQSSVDFSMTYFDTDFGERIVAPLPGLEVLGIFNEPLLYAALIERDPDPVTVPEGVEAIIDRRLQNISVTQVRGIDMRATRDVTAGLSDFSVELDLSYLIDYEETLTPDAQERSVRDTAYHPVDLRARLGVTWERSAWSASAFLNYVDDFTNATATPTLRVGSWTPLDLQLTYETPARLAWGQTRIALNVINAFDEAPPSLSSPVAQYQRGFDPTNASALGRFISLAVTQSW